MTAAPLVADTTSLAFTEADAAKVIDSDLTLSDVDSANLTGATVTNSGNFVSSEDVLAVTNPAKNSSSSPGGHRRPEGRRSGKGGGAGGDAGE